MPQYPLPRLIQGEAQVVFVKGLCINNFPQCKTPAIFLS